MKKSTTQKVKREYIESVRECSVEFWTDGTPRAWGVVAKRNSKYTEIVGDLPKTTNNRAELTAILKALTMLTFPGDKVVIHTDSKYCIRVLFWNWKAKKNLDLIEAIWEASRDRDIIYQYISGEDNWRADFLSRLGRIKR